MNSWKVGAVFLVMLMVFSSSTVLETAADTPPTPTDWPMFRHNPNHTGYSPSSAPDTANLLWNYTTGDNVDSSPAVVDGKVYVGSGDNKVYCLNASTGTHIWNYTTGDDVDSSPAVADGKVYIGSFDDKLYCLNATTGTHIWNYTTGGWVTSSPAVADGKVYVGSFDHKLYCLNASTGSKIWSYTTGDHVYYSSPAVVDGRVYVGSSDNMVYCMNASTGTPLWNYTTGDDVYSSPAVADGKVYIGSIDDKLYCLNATTGTHIWNYTTGDDVSFSSPAVVGGRIYVGSYNTRLYCLNASTGTPLWNYTTGSWVYSSPAVADGKVYVGSSDKKLYCLNATTGTHIWNYTTGSVVFSSPAVADGKVYVGSCDDKVYAFGVAPANPPVISNFTVTPNVNVNPGNPATISANVADPDGDLYTTYIMVVDSNNLTGANETLLWSYMDYNGANKVYSAQWGAKTAKLANDTVMEYPVTLRMYESMGHLYYLAAGVFSNPDVSGYMLYNENLSLIATQNMAGANVTVQDGVTTFTVQMYKWATEETVDGATFTLYADLLSPNNPQLVFVEVPNGAYSAYMSAVDGSGTVDDNWVTTEAASIGKGYGQIQMTSQWKTYDVTLDGNQTTPDEWSDVNPVDLFLNPWPNTTLPAFNGRVWIKNDGTWLYVLLRVPFAVGEGDGAYFNTRYQGTDPNTVDGGTPPDDYGGVWYYSGAFYPWDGHYTGTGQNVVNANDGTQNVNGSGSYDGTYCWFEYRKMLNSGDGQDMVASQGDTIGINIIFRDSVDTNTTQWYMSSDISLDLSALDWPMFRHDLNHTGYSPSTAPNTANLLWNYTTGGDVSSSPAVVDGKVYIGSNDGNLYCLNASTGTKIWSYTTISLVGSSPAVASGKVYVGSDDSKLYCLNASTGAEIWNYTTGGCVYSSPAVADGRVYVGSYDYKLYCLNASTGAHIWNYTTGGKLYSSPAVADGKVYVGSYDNKVYCLNVSTGTPLWNYTTGGWVRSSPAVADGRVYVGSYDNKLYCLNASTGDYIWNYSTGNLVLSSPAVASGKVYVGSIDGKLYSLNASTGTLIWNYTTGDDVYSSPAVADGKVYVGSTDWNVYCLNASTGVKIWNYTTGNDVWSSPAVADGKVYVGSYDCRVYAFGGTAVDVTPPAISNLTPANNSYVNTATPTISATVTDDYSGVDASSIAMTLNGSSVSPSFNPATGYLNYTPPSALSQATYVVSLFVADNDGNNATTVWWFTIDTTSPTITNLTPTNQSYTNSTTPTISATVTDTNMNITSINLTINGTEVTPTYNTTTGYLNYTPSPALTDGLYVIYVCATDNASNQRCVHWRFTVDTVIPDLSNPSPTPNSKIKDKRPTISIHALDSNINSTSITMIIDSAPITSNYNSSTGLLNYTPPTDLSDGVHSASVYVMDLAHNANSTSWNFTVYSAWDIGLTLTCDYAPFTSVMFGVNPNATSSYDGNPYDVVAPPLPPSPNGTEFYFHYPSYNTTYQKLAKSTLNTTDTLEWTLKVAVVQDTPQEWVDNVTVTWNASDMASVPQGYALTLTDNNTGTPVTVNMRTQSNYTFLANITQITIPGYGSFWIGDTYTFTLRASTAVEHTFNLAVGWNMVGIPFGLTENDPDEVFPGYTLWTWDAQNTMYRIPSSLDAGVGYWILADTATTIQLPL